MLEDSHLYQEIHQQPQVLARFLTSQKEAVAALATAVIRRGIAHVMIAARGSSDNAGRYAKYLLGAANGLPVALAAPSLFSLYRRPPRLHNTLVLGISQSGRSPDIISVLAEGRRQGALTAAITNVPDSALAAQADLVIDLQAGAEQSVAATKTYTSQLLAIAALGTALAQDGQMAAELARLPEAVDTCLQMAPQVAAAAERYRYMNHCAVIGRGYNYATAYELALKLKELTYTIAEPYSSADFLHGPLALVDHGFPVLIAAPSGVVLPEVLAFVDALHQRQAEIIAISDDPVLLRQARIPLTLPITVAEWLSPLTAIVPGQLLAMYLAFTRDYDPDHPRGLRKVTETQ